jgi:hypothetical protein
MDFGYGSYNNVAFIGSGRIAVVVGYNSHFVVVEVERNVSNPDQLIFKRKVNSSGGVSG